MTKSVLFMFLVAGLIFSHAPQAEAAKQVALVIGNSAYKHTRALPNPKNDAKAIASELRAIGFNVELKLDAGYDSLRRALRDFANLAYGADVALVFYAGHGMELGGHNYLIPTDARLNRDVDTEYEAVKLSSVMRSVKGARRLGLVILDACRNNPLTTTMQLAQGATRSVTRGLARVEPSGDVLVAYAAREGTVAQDGYGKHSPYTTALLKHLRTPGLEIRRLFGKVRDDVRKLTKRVQQPATYGSLGGDAIYLVPKGHAKRVKPSGSPKPSGGVSAAEAWAIVEKSTNTAILEAFRKRYEGTFFSDLARTRIQQLNEQSKSAVNPSDRPKAAPQTHSGDQRLASYRRDAIEDYKASKRRAEALESRNNPTRWHRAERRFISIGTGGVTGVYYPTGGAICRLVNANRNKTGMRCSAESTGGSIYNINTVRAGELEFGLAQSDWQHHAYYGQSKFARRGAFQKLRAVFSVHPEPVTIIARDGSGILDIADLKGKRVNIGNPGSGTRAMWNLIKATMGWTDADLKLMTEFKSSQSSQMLCDDRIDAYFWLVGHPSALTQDGLSDCDAHLVNAWTPELASIVREQPFYRKTIIPAGLYNNTEDIVTFGVGATVITSSDVPKSVVFNVAKAVFDNFSTFRKLHPAFKELSVSEMIKDSLSAPLHPGALEYYRSRGWM